MFALQYSKRDPAKRIPRFAATAATVTALLVTAFSAHAVPIPGRGTWESTLQARDINSDGTVDAYYDTALDITWLANANAGAGSVFDNGSSNSDGKMTWASAQAWVAALDVHGVTGWRLPVRPDSPAAQELSHMYYVTLGNFGPGNPLTMTGPGTWGFENTGPFSNLFSDWYWTGTPGAPIGPQATAWVWVGDPISAYYSQEPVTGDYFAWAVRSGDVPTAAIPEPSTYALMLAGLLAVVLLRRRQVR